MQASKPKTLLPLASLILAAMTACGGGNAARQETKISTPQSSAVSSAGEVAASPPKISPSDSVKVRAAKISIKAGEKTEATIEIVVADGFHINGNPPTNEYLLPTEIKIENGAGITIGKFIYPAAETKKFAFAEAPISIYQGAIIIKFPIRADKNARIGLTVLHGSLRAQPCNDNACFPQRIVEFSLPVQVRQ